MVQNRISFIQDYFNKIKLANKELTKREVTRPKIIAACFETMAAALKQN